MELTMEISQDRTSLVPVRILCKTFLAIVRADCPDPFHSVGEMRIQGSSRFGHQTLYIHSSIEEELRGSEADSKCEEANWNEVNT